MANQDYEQVSYRGGALSQHTAYAQEVISGVGATRTLLPRESGSISLFDSAAGVTYTLPVPIVGMTYEFATTVTITSNSAKVITNSSSVFIVGGVSLVNNAATTGEGFSANGTTHRSVNGNGTTTGGIIGDRYRLVAISTTVWLVEGILIQSGTAATPFATS